MQLKVIFLVQYPHLTNLLTSIEVLVRIYEQRLSRFSISLFEHDQAALLFELRLASSEGRNKIALAIQNSMEMYGLRIARVFRLFNQDQASVRKIRRKYFGNREERFIIESPDDMDQVFRTMNRKLDI